jgi:hypothetical protein
MRITSAGLVGIGTSSPVQTLHIKAPSGSTTGLRLESSGGTTNFDILSSEGDGNVYLYQRSNYSILIGTNNTERMRITSGGNLLVANTAATGGYDHSFNNVGGSSGTIVFNQTSSATNPCAGFWNNATSGDNIFQRFFVNAGGNQKGSIDFNRGGDVTRYNTTSDGNLKNIIGDSNRQKSIEILNTTRIREYSWKEDETNKPQIGVIAQELYETYKGAVSKGSDDELFGTEDYKEWGVDKTAFTFHLIAGWQKHEQMIQEMNTKIIELEKIVATK